tara:strand:+ start:116 stop:814 length:699 start_codon:yes stop_codon:yes gene_type:complete
MNKANINNFIRINPDMNILAFDLANFSSSFALMKQGKVVFSEHSKEFRGQDVTLLPKLQKVLADHGLAFQELDRVVTTRGPGSFTGIRVALATAQGIAFSIGKSALGLDSFSWVLKTYPKEIPSGQPVLVLLESLRLELYGQLFTAAGEGVGAPFSASPEDIAQNPTYKKALCLGNGAFHLIEYGFQVDPFMPQATQLAEFASTLFEKELEHYPCLPLYVRDADTSKAKALK